MHRKHLTRAVAAGLVAVTAFATLLVGSASADMTCKSGNGAVNCFSTEPSGDWTLRDWHVHIGIDVTMSQQDAQAIIDSPGEEFSAKVIADDPSFDNFLFYVPVTWSASWAGGLSAEFDIVVDGSRLNEDDGWFEGWLDEVYAKISLYDPRSGVTRTWTTNVIVQYY
jgi:hypothetical protein